MNPSGEPSSDRVAERERAEAAARPFWNVHAGLLLVALAVLATGLMVPDLVFVDSTQDAVMAMRMHQQDDWVHLVKNGEPYLDKPHLLFWSAMAGYRLFGVHDWSYRLASVLVSLLGAFATYGLGKRLYDDLVGRTAAVMFLTSYATVLGNHDVRMDALLTGFVAFGLWQLVTWLDTGSRRAMVLGAAGVGLAFSAKGLIAVAVTGAALLFHVWGRGLWRRLRSPHLALGLAVFLLTISPVVYAYWLQFGSAGPRFILLGQTLERFGGGKGARHAGDPLFLFHSLLWAFLPWSLLTFTAWFQRFRALVRGGRAAFHRQDQLTFLGPLVAIALLSLSRYKLAHYLNPFLPMLSVFTAGWLVALYRDARWKTLDRLRRMQHVVVGFLLVALAIVNGWAFPPRNGWVVAGALAFAGLLALGFRAKDPLRRVWVPSALAISLVNFVQSANYHPWLGAYQLGRDEAARLRAMDVDWDHLYFLDHVDQSIQLYTRHVIPRVELATLAELAAGREVFVLAWEHGRTQVRDAGLAHEVRAEFVDCNVRRLIPRVLNPRTRPETCRPVYLLAVSGRAAAEPRR
jgi:4-amino-4-deoxy-L-arabinose transferase-like glycosyltransferase